MSNYSVIIVDILAKLGLDKIEGHGGYKEEACWAVGDIGYELLLRNRLGGALTPYVGGRGSQFLVKGALMTLYEIAIIFVMKGVGGRHKFMWSLINNFAISAADLAYFEALIAAGY